MIKEIHFFIYTITKQLLLLLAFLLSGLYLFANEETPKKKEAKKEVRQIPAANQPSLSNVVVKSPASEVGSKPLSETKKTQQRIAAKEPSKQYSEKDIKFVNSGKDAERLNKTDEGSGLTDSAKQLQTINNEAFIEKVNTIANEIKYDYFRRSETYFEFYPSLANLGKVDTNIVYTVSYLGEKNFAGAITLFPFFYERPNEQAHKALYIEDFFPIGISIHKIPSIYDTDVKSTVLAWGIGSDRLWILRPPFAKWDTLKTFPKGTSVFQCVADSSFQKIDVFAGENEIETTAWYQSFDSGKTWKEVKPSVFSSTSFWIFVATLLLTLLYCIYVWYYIKRKEKQLTDLLSRQNAIVKENELRLSHDSAIERLQDDKLGFKPTVNAIVSLIKNPETQLPLNIVISGSWGSGKSSLMSMIKDQLPKERYDTIWFNAWHLQNETNLLATFIGSLINGIKGSYGLRFKVKLFKTKLQQLSFFKQWYIWVLVGFVAPIVCIMLLKLLQPIAFFGIPLISDIPVLGWFATIFDYLFQILFHNAENDKSFVFISSLVTIISTALGLIFFKKELLPKTLSSFVDLIPMKEFQIESSQQDPSYRERFKKEFWEVIRSSNPEKKIVVFIDDLDRISGKRILEVLETINFITDTASKPAGFDNAQSNLIFVMGMASKEVANNIGAQLLQSGETTNTEGIENKRIELGVRFLEKMVQLTIAVPAIQESKLTFLSDLVLRNSNGNNSSNEYPLSNEE